jgi:diguanylate cyclase (GGDEF)-like protein
VALPDDALPDRASLSRQLAWLRFRKPMEAEFRADYERSAPPARITLQLLGILLIGVTPLYDERLLSAPREFLMLERALDFGVEIPAIFVTLILTLVPSLRRYSAPATTLTTLLVAVCFMVQRLAGMPIGFHVPHDLPVVAISAALVLSRLRLYSILPWSLGVLAALTTIELARSPGPDTYYDTISVWMLFLISGLAAYMIERSARESWYRGRLLQRIAHVDALTGLANRRHFDVELLRLVGLAQREQRRLALMIFDIDRFKAYNDHYGHPAGDACLRRIGEHLGSAMRRPLDFCARIGGEEFAAVWFDASVDDARAQAEALRAGVETLAIPAAPGGRAMISCSAGLATIEAPPTTERAGDVVERLLRTADSALYDAKRAGRATLVCTS